MRATFENPGYGVYVHIPFCRHRCDYCAFATFTDRDHIIEKYLESLSIEISRAIASGMPIATSIFVGGGTPTRVPPEMLMKVLASIPVTADAEVTIECNPDDITSEMLRIFREGGVNRLSFGVQSMQTHVLKSLGRTHNPENVEKSVALAREAGFDDINLDIIYGVHGESIADWKATVESVLLLKPTHVSAYGLTVEGGTPLADDPARHPDDDLQAEMYEVVDDLLTAAGMENYEVSNWSMPGRECQHNRLYWFQGDYAGFGSAAHAHHDGRRSWNVRTPDRFIELIDSDQSAESSSEILDGDAQRIEGLQLALRMREGVPVGSFSASDLELMKELVRVNNGQVTLTRAGRLMANEVALRLK
ncbi:MAG: putative oxygen-independent coproporphyrinogen oxidase [Actinomycetota bacterium]